MFRGLHCPAKLLMFFPSFMITSDGNTYIYIYWKERNDFVFFITTYKIHFCHVHLVVKTSCASNGGYLCLRTNTHSTGFTVMYHVVSTDCVMARGDKFNSHSYPAATTVSSRVVLPKVPTP